MDKTPSLAEAKAFLRIDGDHDDVLVQALLASAVAFVLRMTGKISSDADDVKAGVLLVRAGLWEHRDSHDEARRTVLHPILKMLLESARVDHSCV